MSHPGTYSRRDRLWEQTDPKMSTRKLILTSLVLGVVILVAFAVQILIAT